MTRERVAIALLFLTAAACGSSAGSRPSYAGAGETAGQPSVPADEPEAGAAAMPTAGGGSSVPSAGGAGQGDTTSVELGGAGSNVVEVVEEPPGDDAATLETTPQVFLPTTEAFYVFDRAGAVADRRFALDTASLALVSFDAHGEDPSEVVLDAPLAAAPRGDDLVVLGLDDEQQLITTTYDAKLERKLGHLALASTATGAHAVACTAEKCVAAWSEASALHGLLFDTTGALGDGFDFGVHSCGAYGCRAKVANQDGRFVVVWSRTDATGEGTISWGTIDEQGAALSARNVLHATNVLDVEDVAVLPNGRLAVLVSFGSPAENPLLLFLDRFGDIEPTVHVYSGATAAWTLASDGQSLLVSARSESSQGVVRQLDLHGEPQSDWLIVDDSGTETDFEPRVALFSSAEGLSAVVRMTDGSSATLDLDPESFPKP
jgi:hypothetical protein